MAKLTIPWEEGMEEVEGRMTSTWSWKPSVEKQVLGVAAGVGREMPMQLLHHPEMYQEVKYQWKVDSG